jgi:hypothetical protein
MVLRERRAHPRHRDRGRHGVSSLRVKPGHGASLVNISAGGLLLESDRRLCPGSTIDVQLGARDGVVALRGFVMRCAVVHLSSGGIRYEGAIQFDRALGGMEDAPALAPAADGRTAGS